MADDVEGMMIPGQRVLVVNDLGPVHKGDHLVMVANVVVAVDTSRRPDDVKLSSERPYRAAPNVAVAPVQRRKYKRRTNNAVSTLSLRQLHSLIRNSQPISSMTISDNLGLRRDDLAARAKVGRLLKALLTTGQIKRVEDERLRVFRYVVVEESTAATS